MSKKNYQAIEVTVLREKKILDFDLFCLRNGPKRELSLLPNLPKNLVLLHHFLIR